MPRSLIRVVLDTTDELDGLTHRAVGVARITPERALPGKAAKWRKGELVTFKASE